MKQLFRFLSILSLLFGVNSVCHAQAAELFTTPGVGTWVCPIGITSVTVECWGGGGAGGGGSYGGAVVKGGGGAGGGYAKKTITVVPGLTYTFMVGAGGVGSVPTVDNETAQSGSKSFFINENTINAPGGTGGKGRITSTPTVLFGDGGIYDNSTAVGSLIFKGGNGGTANSKMSGSGGSSGGTASDGTNGDAVNTKSIVEGGGYGAQGRNNLGNGIAGGIPGGGGSGCRCNSDTQKGGNGGDGQIKLSYLAGFSQTTVVINCETNLPDVNYKRGTAAPGMGGFFDNVKTREYLDYQRSIGMTIFNGIRNLFKDGQTNEFYFENGEYKNQQIPKFTNIRKYAGDLGFELISQVGGTPTNSNYEFDSTYYKQPWGDTSDTDFAPIPKEGKSMQEFQRNFAEWAINADKAIAPDFHSIWIGTQEIVHTIGFPGGIQYDTDANKKLNIRRFTDYWKPISDTLRAAGAKTGGLQLNSSNANMYNYAVDYMIQQKLQLDYLTYQFYQWGDTADLVAAVKATKRYSQAYPGAKMIIDRGGHSKLVPDGASAAQAVIYFLVGELGAMNYADWVYAYTPDRQINGMDQDKNTLLWLTRAWINTIGNKRCSLMDLPAGVDGFVTRTDKKLSAAIWNRSSIPQQFGLKITNSTLGADAKLTAKLASGKSFVRSSARWNAATNTVDSISLKPFEYILLDLETPSSVGLTETLTEKVNVYPNPVNDRLYINNLNDNTTIKIYDIQGKLWLIQEHFNSNDYIDVSGFSRGTYILKIKGNNIVKTTSFVKI